MKVTIEVDCSSEEARALLGLPHLTPLHDEVRELLDSLDRVDGRGSIEQTKTL